MTLSTSFSDRVAALQLPQDGARRGKHRIAEGIFLGAGARLLGQRQELGDFRRGAAHAMGFIKH